MTLINSPPSDVSATSVLDPVGVARWLSMSETAGSSTPVVPIPRASCFLSAQLPSNA